MALGSYAPPARLPVGALKRHWPGAGSPPGVSTVAVAGFDEDVVTLAVEALDAALAAAGRPSSDIDGVVLASCSSPYAEHSTAAEVARALDVRRSALLVDLAGSVRGGVTGLVLAADVVRAGRAQLVAVIAAERRRGRTGTAIEALGSGAVAALVGIGGAVAIGPAVTWRHGVPARWRTADSAEVVQYDDPRFERNEQLAPAWQGVLDQLQLETPLDFVALGHFDARSGPALLRATAPADLGLDEIAELGDLGVAGPLFSLAACLERSRPGAAGACVALEAGAGADAVLLTVGPRASLPIERRRPLPITIDYVEYLQRFGVLMAPPPPDPIVSWPATPGALRDDHDGALAASVCHQCGSFNIPPRSLCIDCGSDRLEVRAAPRHGRIVTYNRQFVVAVHPEPAPVAVAVVRLDGTGGQRGGQVSAMVCDSDLDALGVGTPVELVYRRVGVEQGLAKYGWKARVVLEQPAAVATT